MTMISCHECKRDVSTEAKKCPNCGAKVRLPKKPTSKVLLVALGAAAVLTAVVMSNNKSERDEAQSAEAARFAALTPAQRTKEQSDKAQQADKAAADAAAKATEDARREAVAHDIGLAEVTCSMAAEKAANDPSSVEWLRQERQFKFVSADKTKAVSVQPMRAKNRAGGLVRTAVTCELVKSGGQWGIKRMSEAR